MCRHREIKDSLCCHRTHGLVRESKHGNGNYNTVSKKHKDEKKPQEAQKRTREKDTKKPRGAEKEEGRSRDTQECLEREQEKGTHRCACMHTYAYICQPLCCAGVQKKAPSQEPLLADPKLFPARMREWGLGMAKLSP